VTVTEADGETETETETVADSASTVTVTVTDRSGRRETEVDSFAPESFVTAKDDDTKSDTIVIEVAGSCDVSESSTVPEDRAQQRFAGRQKPWKK
jgi:hypothetical protein